MNIMSDEHSLLATALNWGLNHAILCYFVASLALGNLMKSCHPVSMTGEKKKTLAA